MKRRWNYARIGMSILAFTLTVFILQTHNISVYADELTESTTETTLEECPEEQSDESEETIGTDTESSEESEENFTEQPEEESIEITEIFDDATETPTEETLDAESSLGIMNVRPRIAADSEKPVIHKDTLYISNNSVTIGDTVTVGVKVTDNFDVDRVMVSFFNNDLSQIMAYNSMIFNTKNGYFEYTFVISENMPAGKWSIYDIMAYDSTGNIDSEPFDECFFIILNPDIDSEKPSIDASTLSISKNCVEVGDQVIIRVKATDNIAVSKITLLLFNSDAGNNTGYVKMYYNKELDLFEYIFDINENVTAGQWYISYISANDSAGNSDIKSFSKDEYYFYVINDLVDSEPPFIDEKTLSITPYLAKTNDTVNISIKVTDNVSVKDVKIDLFNKDTYQSFSYLPMDYNERTESYEYKLLIDDTIAAGHWEVEISSHDINENFSLMSGYGHYFFATDSGKELHKWDNGYISKPATATEDGIKTYICTVCYDTKEEIIPATGEEDGDDENPTDPGDNETEIEIPETHPDTNKPDSKPDPDDNISSDDENKNQHVWIPTTPEEAKRYKCYGKEKVQFAVPDDNPYPVTIENAMQGSKCFEVFENASNGFTIGRTYNIFPKGNMSNISTGEKVKITLTIPDELCKEGRIFKMICVSGKGIPTVLDDLDESNGSITFETDKYYAFALVYSDIK